VTLHNPGDRIAFFVELSVVGDRSGRLAAPVYWDDNYVSLLPGERREVRGILPVHALGGEQPLFRYRAMNQGGEATAGGRRRR
jgi:exo-1,4-beta-D-glucosaminidase